MSWCWYSGTFSDWIYVKVHSSDVVDVSRALVNPPDDVIDRLSQENGILTNSRRGSKEIYQFRLMKWPKPSLECDKHKSWIGEWRCNCPSFLGNYFRPIDHPTNRQAITLAHELSLSNHNSIMAMKVWLRMGIVIESSFISLAIGRSSCILGAK